MENLENYIIRVDIMNITLKQLKKDLEEIAGQWNGDNPGIQEDDASIANEVIEKINEIKELLTFE